MTSAAEPKAAASAATRRSALLGLAEHVWMPERSRWVLRLRYERIAATTLASLALLYFGAAGAKYAENRWIRECEETSYPEMCLFIFPDKIPFTKKAWAPAFVTRICENARESHRRKLANVLFNKAQQFMREKNWGRFFQSIFAATKLDPANKDARILAAQALFALRRDDDALDALDEAIPDLLENREFIREFLTVCLAREQDSRLVGVAKYHLAHSPLNPATKEAFNLALAGARYFRGEFEACLKLIQTPELARNRDAFLMRVNILTESGRTKEAIQLLEAAANQNPNDADLIAQALTLKTAIGDRDGARNDAALYLIRASHLHQARLKQMDLLDPVSEKARLDEMTASYLRDFAGKEQPLLMLCEFAAHNGNTDLCENLMKTAAEAKFREGPRFRLLYVESHLAKKRYEETVRLVDEIFLENPTWLAQYRLTFDSLRTVAHFAMNREDTGEIGYKRIAESQENLNPQFMETVARRLIEVGRPEEGVRIATLCRERNKGSVAALLTLITIELEAGGTPDTPKHLREYLQYRRPRRAILEKARHVIAGDAYLFEPGRATLITDLEKLLNGTGILPEPPQRAPKQKTA